MWRRLSAGVEPISESLRFAQRTLTDRREHLDVAAPIEALWLVCSVGVGKQRHVFIVVF
jgi:hypothetical protein